MPLSAPLAMQHTQRLCAGTSVPTWEPYGSLEQYSLQGIGRQVFQSVGDAPRAEGRLKAADPRHGAKITFALTADAADFVQAMAKRQDVLTTWTGSVDRSFLYKSHVLPPALMVKGVDTAQRIGRRSQQLPR